MRVGPQNTSNDRLRGSSSSMASGGMKSKRKSTSLPSETVEYLKSWMMSPEHIVHPYPTEQEKQKIMEETGIELKQLTNWFVNNRKRYWKPRVEARLQEQSGATSPSLTSLKAPSPGSPDNRNMSLIHVLSTPNVVAFEDHTACNHSSDSNCSARSRSGLSDVSCSASENGSVGNVDHDDMSTGIAARDLFPCKEYDDVQILRPYSGQVSVTDVVVGSAHYVVSEDAPTCVSLSSSDESKEDKKRKATAAEEFVLRPKYLRKSVDVWKKACHEANHGYCDTLPTLEEAARLFGFATS